MQRKKWLLFFIVPLLTHLGCVIYFHFDENILVRHFEHGFKNGVSHDDYSSINPILNQPFRQIGQGRQMTAFESADGKYVLKLFNPRRPQDKGWYLSWKNWKRTYSLKWISTQWFRKGQRLEKMYDRLKIAFSLMPEETGLLFLHLAPSDQVHPTLHLIDKKGKTHLLHLNQTPFVIQRKAILAADYLDQLVKENQIEKAKQAIASIEELFAKRLELGITDENQTMHNNYGFIDGKAIQIDVGRIRIDPELPDTEEKRILETFHAWISAQYPSIH